jgi:hypothetical protein
MFRPGRARPSGRPLSHSASEQFVTAGPGVRPPGARSGRWRRSPVRRRRRRARPPARKEPTSAVTANTTAAQTPNVATACWVSLMRHVVAEVIRHAEARARRTECVRRRTCNLLGRKTSTRLATVLSGRWDPPSRMSWRIASATRAARVSRSVVGSLSGHPSARFRSVAGGHIRPLLPRRRWS